MPTVGDLISIYSTQSQISSLFIDKMGIINVKSFGAIGDGVTDDSKAVQDAIDSAIENKIGMVWLPSGTYLISTALTNTDKVVFMSNSTDTVFSGNTYPIKNWSDMINDADLDAHKTSSDHDGRYYTETEVDNIVATHEADTTTHGTTGDIVGTTDTQTLTNKTINADNNTISNLEVDNFKSGVLDTDIESVSANDDTLPSAKAVKTYADRMKGFSLDLPYYYQRNVKQIATCEADEGWADYASSGVIISNDTVDYKVGSQSKKMVFPTGYRAAILNNLSLRIDNFNDTSESSNNDYISFCIKSDRSDSFILIFCNRTSYDNINIAEAFFNVSNGWNYIKIPKTSFTYKGDFTTFDGTTIGSIGLKGNNLSAITTISLDNIQLIRKDPLEDKPNPFQREINGVWTRDMTINSGEWFVGEEFGEIVCRELSNSLAVGNFLSTKTYVDCVIANIVTTKNNAAWFGGPVFYIDNNNYIYSYVGEAGYELILKTVIGGSSTVVKKAFACSIGDKVHFKLIKEGTSIILCAVKNGDYSNTYSITSNFSHTGAGKLGWADLSEVDTTINHLAITTTSYASEAGNAHATYRNAVLYNAGAFTANTLPEGKYGIDTTNHRLYVKYPNGTVKYVALT